MTVHEVFKPVDGCTVHSEDSGFGCDGIRIYSIIVLSLFFHLLRTAPVFLLSGFSCNYHAHYKKIGLDWQRTVGTVKMKYIPKHVINCHI